MQKNRKANIPDKELTDEELFQSNDAKKLMKGELSIPFYSLFKR